MKIVWLCPYPIDLLKPEIKLKREIASYHPCNWIINLSKPLSIIKEIELHIITLSPLINKNQLIVKNHIHFHIIKSAVPFTHKGYPRYLPFNMLTRFILERAKLVSEIKKIEPDIVHSHGTEGPFAMAGQDSGYPNIISIQGIISELYKTNPSFNFWIVRNYERQTIKKALHIGCRTDFDKSFIKSLNPSANVLYSPEAMDPIYFSNKWQDNNTYKLLYVGSIIKRKGVETLLKAVSIVKKKYPNVLLSLIGGGTPSYLKFLKTIGEQLDISNNFKFLGFQSPDKIAYQHTKSDLFVFPSENDNSPNSVAEAMVTGMPIVATSVGGLPSMIQNNKTGMLFPTGNAEQLAKIIINLFQNRKQMKLLSENAKATAREKHMPGKVAQITLENYQTILGQVKKHSFSTRINH